MTSFSGLIFCCALVASFEYFFYMLRVASFCVFSYFSEKLNKFSWMRQSEERVLYSFILHIIYRISFRLFVMSLISITEENSCWKKMNENMRILECNLNKFSISFIFLPSTILFSRLSLLKRIIQRILILLQTNLKCHHEKRLTCIFIYERRDKKQ
jgi:ABC-type proline/glycine betaine transport system permease subunit